MTYLTVERKCVAKQEHKSVSHKCQASTLSLYCSSCALDNLNFESLTEQCILLIYVVVEARQERHG